MNNIITKGTSFSELLTKLDAWGAIERKIKIREQLGLKQIWEEKDNGSKEHNSKM